MTAVQSAIAPASSVPAAKPNARSMSDQRSSAPIEADPVSAMPVMRSSARADEMRSARSRSRSVIENNQASAPADERHRGRRDRQELDVGVERQGRHIQDRVGGVPGVEGGLGQDGAVGLEDAAADPLGQFGGGV